MHGPPMYFTPNWQAAHRSVETLAALNPQVAVTGHGLPMAGDLLHSDLNRLARDFEQLAVPVSGRYVDEPAVTNRTGVVSVPPAPPHAGPDGLVAFGVAALATMFLASRLRR